MHLSAPLAASLQAVFGVAVFLGLAYAMSENRPGVRWGPVLQAVGVQVALALLTTYVDAVHKAMAFCSRGIGQLKAATKEGTKFVFGYVGGGPSPFEVVQDEFKLVFAFEALPMVMVVSALSMLLFYWQVLPALVRVASWVFRRTLRVGGALGVCAAAKIFLGQTEAPLLIRPYLKDLSRSELFSVMTLGMATTSASVMVLYGSVLDRTMADPISHILTASVISVPGALALSRLFVPQTGKDTEGTLDNPYAFRGSMEAVSTGATDGMKLMLNIIAMLVVMTALVSLANTMLGTLVVAGDKLSLQRILGSAMAPAAWLMGIPWAEAAAAGRLIGVKVAINEFIAFVELAKTPATQLSELSRLTMLYALSGFANLASVGIQIGGFGTMVPERRHEVIEFGLKSMVAGTMASCMSGAIVGILQHWC